MAGNVPEKLIRWVLRKVPPTTSGKAQGFTSSDGYDLDQDQILDDRVDNVYPFAVGVHFPIAGQVVAVPITQEVAQVGKLRQLGKLLRDYGADTTVEGPELEQSRRVEEDPVLGHLTRPVRPPAKPRHRRRGRSGPRECPAVPSTGHRGFYIRPSPSLPA